MIRADAGAHEGIVEDPLVHSSSLVSTRLAPPRSAARSSSAAASSAVAPDADDALVHSSSLVATRLSPAKSAAATPPPSATAAAPAKASASASPASKGTAKPLLYVSPTCPFAQRAWVAMLEKGVDFDLRLENLEAKSANLQDAYKAGTPEAEPLVAKVPVLCHDGLTLVESALVAEYAARAFPGGEAIAYADAAEAYGGGLFVAQFNAITPAYFRALRAKSQKDVDAALDDVRAGLRQAERALAISQRGSDGPYACGARFTLADATTCTMNSRLAVVLGHFRAFRLHAEVETMGLVRLAKWMDACAERPSVRETTRIAAEATGMDFGSAIVDFSKKFVSWTG